MAKTTTYVLAGYDLWESVTKPGAFYGLKEAMLKRQRAQGDVVVLEPIAGETMEQLAAKIKPPANIIIAAHGSETGQFEWNSGQHVYYSEFFSYLKEGVKTVSVTSCYGETSLGMLASLPEGAFLQSLVGRKVEGINLSTSQFGKELAARPEINQLSLMLEALDNVRPSDFEKWFKDPNVNLKRNTTDVLPHTIGFGGKPPTKIDLNDKVTELALKSRQGTVDAQQFESAVALVRQHFDPDAGGAHIRMEDRITKVANKLRSGQDISRLDLEDTRVAYAITMAHMHTSGEFEKIKNHTYTPPQIDTPSQDHSQDERQRQQDIERREREEHKKENPGEHHPREDIGFRREQFEERQRQRRENRERAREDDHRRDQQREPEDREQQHSPSHRGPIHHPFDDNDQRDAIRQRRERYEERRQMRRQYHQREKEERRQERERERREQSHQPPREEHEASQQDQRPSLTERAVHANEAFGASAAEIRALQENLHILGKDLGPYGEKDAQGNYKGNDGIHGRYTQGAWLSAQHDLGIDPPSAKYNPDIARQIQERAAAKLREQAATQPTQEPPASQSTSAPTPDTPQAGATVLSSWAGEALATPTTRPQPSPELPAELQHTLATTRGDHTSHNMEDGQAVATGTKERRPETTHRE